MTPTDSFRDDVVKFMPSMMSFAISLTRNNAAAEDLVQNTIMLALKYENKFQRGTNLHAWLFTIMRNRFLSSIRKSWREEEWDPILDDSLGVSCLGPDADGASNDLAKLVRVLAALPAEQRDALIAIGYLGMPYDEAAERLGCAVGTIKSRVNRARVRAEELMEDFQVTVDIAPLRRATATVPQGDAYYPIAKAIEELCQYECGDDAKSVDAMPSEQQAAWEKLVASGALDESWGAANA